MRNTQIIPKALKQSAIRNLAIANHPTIIEMAEASRRMETKVTQELIVLPKCRCKDDVIVGDIEY